MSNEIRPSILRRLFKDSLTYGTSEMATKVFALLLAPILTRLLSPSDFGVLDLLAMFVAFSVPFAVAGFDSSLQSFYYDRTLYPSVDDRKCLVSTVLWFIAGLAVVLAGAIAWAAPALSRLVFSGKVEPALIRTAGCLTGAWAAFWFVRQILRLKFLVARFAVLSWGVSVLSSVAGVAVLVVWEGNLRAYYATYAACIAIGALAGFFLIRAEIGFRFDGAVLRQGLSVGLPFMPSTLLALVMAGTDRFVLTHQARLAEVGLYAIGSKIASVLAMGITMFSLAWFPLAVKTYHESVDEYPGLFSRALLYVTALFTTGAVLVTAAAPTVLKILAPPVYAPAAQVVGPLSLALVAQAVGQITSIGTTLKRRPVLGLIITFITVVANVAMCLTLVPRWGMVGAAWALATAQALFAGLFWVLTERLLRPYRFERVKTFSITFTGVVAVVAFSAGSDRFGWVGVAGGALHAFALWRIGVLAPGRIPEVLSWLKNRFRSASVRG